MPSSVRPPEAGWSIRASSAGRGGPVASTKVVGCRACKNADPTCIGSRASTGDASAARSGRPR